MKLQAKTIEKALESSDRHVVKVAVKNCIANRNIDQEIVRKWRESDNLAKNTAAIFARHQAKPDADFKEKLDKVSNLYGYEFACELLAKAFVPATNLWFVYPTSEYGEYYSKKLILDGIKKPVSTKKISEWIKSDKWYDQASALYYCTVDPLFVPNYEVIEIFKNTMDKDVIEASIVAIRAKELPMLTLRRLYEDAGSITKRLAVMKMLYGRTDLDINIDPESLSEEEIKALTGIMAPKKQIDAWWSSTSKRTQAAAIYLGKNRQMPSVFFGKALRSDDPLLYEAGVATTYKTKGYDPVRQNKTDVVYKKCVGNVIVKAFITKNASTRETGTNQGRADQLHVEEIIGDFFGEKIGFSFYDSCTQYQEHRNIAVSNFNPTFAENTTGLHYFTDEKAARKFFY